MICISIDIRHKHYLGLRVTETDCSRGFNAYILRKGELLKHFNLLIEFFVTFFISDIMFQPIFKVKKKKEEKKKKKYVKFFNYNLLCTLNLKIGHSVFGETI